MEYDIITWETIDKAVLSLTNQIKESGVNYEVIYGLARGGLVPAVMLSHSLKVPIVLNMEEVWRLKVKGKDVLIVDDISDTGETLKYFKDQNIDIATLYTRVHTTKTFARYNAFEVNHDNWLMFPWETLSSSK